MNKIKEILNKYLTPEQIELCAMEEQAQDWYWLEMHGYSETEYHFVKGYKIPCGNKLTGKGIAYQKEYNHKFDELFDKCTQEDWRRKDEGRKKLCALKEKTYGQEWEKMVKILTEKERWAVRNLTTVTW